MYVLAVPAESPLSAGAGGRSASPASSGALAGPDPGTIALELATAHIPQGWRHKEPAILLLWPGGIWLQPWPQSAGHPYSQFS